MGNTKEQAPGAEAAEVKSTDILTKNGTPFRTEAAANVTMLSKKLRGVQPVKVDGGWVLRAVFNTKSTPESSEEDLADILADAPAVDNEELAEEAETPPAVAPRVKKFRIMIAEQDNWDKNNDVFVTDGFTGKQYLIKRGHEVIVPEGVVNVLKESIIEHLEYDDHGNERSRNIPRFALSILGEA